MAAGPWGVPPGPRQSELSLRELLQLLCACHQAQGGKPEDPLFWIPREDEAKPGPFDWLGWMDDALKARSLACAFAVLVGFPLLGFRPAHGVGVRLSAATSLLPP